ncbi:MAG: hypothetical protein WA947_12945 [Phormidesmis sp.]
MNYNASNRTGEQSAAGNAIASLFVASVMFVLGYTVVRAVLAETTPVPTADANVEVIVPHEGTLWAGFGTEF